MSEQVQTTSSAGIPAAGGGGRLSLHEAVQSIKQASAPNPASEAGRTLAARAAEARAERRAQAEAAVSQEAEAGTTPEDPAAQADPSGEDNPQAEPSTVEPDATVTDDAAPEPESEPAEPTIEIEGLGKLTASEIKNGYARQADATRKWQQASELNKRASEALDQRVPELDKLIAALKSEVSTEPDWEKLAETDPLGWPKAKAAWEKRQAVLKQAGEARQREEVKKLAAAQESMWADIAGGKYADDLPPAKLATLIPEIGKHARKLGYSTQEIAEISDARELILLAGHMRATATRAEVPKALKRVEGKPPAQKPGARPVGVSAQQTQFSRERESLLSQQSMTAQEAVDRMKRLAKGGRAA